MNFKCNYLGISYNHNTFESKDFLSYVDADRSSYEDVNDLISYIYADTIYNLMGCKYNQDAEKLIHEAIKEEFKDFDFDNLISYQNTEDDRVFGLWYEVKPEIVDLLERVEKELNK